MNRTTRPLLTRTVVLLVVALLATTSGAAAVCTLDCAAEAATLSRAAESASAHHHHHAGPLPLNKEKNSQKKHSPCGGDLHHGRVINAAVVKMSADLAAFSAHRTALIDKEPATLNQTILACALAKENGALPHRCALAPRPLRI